MTATTSTALATIQPAFTGPERLALAGFLAGYRGLTREAYTLDLRQFSGWCRHDRCRCSRFAAPTSRPSPASWKPAAAPAPPSPGGCVFRDVLRERGGVAEGEHVRDMRNPARRCRAGFGVHGVGGLLILMRSPR